MVSNAQNWNGDFAVNSPSTAFYFVGPVTLGGNRSLQVDAPSNLYGLFVEGGVGDGGNSYGLTKTGSGALNLSGFNTYTGNTTITTGTLYVGTNSASGLASSSGGSATNGAVLGSGNYAGNIVNNSAFNFGSAQNQILAGVISGTGVFLKTSTGTLTLTNATT